MKIPDSALDAILCIPAAGYFSIQKLRERAYRSGILKSKRAPVPVISVGNLLMGGSGKTPLVIHIANMLTAAGRKPAVISRGYRGRNRLPYLVVGPLDTEASPGPEIVGDEPYLISRRLPETPVIIGRKRIHPAMAAWNLFGSDTVVLDDGFQHMPLARDVNIVVLNGAENCMFPRGSLREPLSALRRADVVVFMGEDPSVLGLTLARFAPNKPLFTCRQVPIELVHRASSELLDPSELKGLPVMLVSGIAHPERFRNLAEHLRWNISGHRVFADHHPFTDREIEEMLSLHPEAIVVFTEKDWVKIPTWCKNTGRAMALRIGLSFNDSEGFRFALLSRLGNPTRCGSGCL